MADPVEKSENVVEEVDRGRSERTPFVLWGGMHLVVGALVAVVLAIVVIAYLLA